MKQRVRHLLSILLVCAMVLSLLPISVLAEELETPLTTVTEPTEVPEVESDTEEDPEPAIEPEEEITPNPAQTIYVSSEGNDANDGSNEEPYATLAKAVEQAEDGAVIYVMTNLTVNTLARVTDKHVTVTSVNPDNPVTLTRGSVQGADNNQSHYNSAMIEVTTFASEDSDNASSVTLTDIILDDAGKHDGTYFAQTNSSSISESNLDFVQDSMVTAHGKGNRAVNIILGEGAVLKDYGGMSAVYGTMNAHITMKAGAVICDETVADRSKSATPHKEETGPAGAVWLQGAEFIMETGAEIRNMVGRAVYADGGSASIDGDIYNINGDVDMWQSITGIAIHARGNSNVTLTGSGKISKITTGKDSNDSVVATYGSNFTMDKGSEIFDLENITALYADDIGNNYTHNMLINGTVRDCTTSGSLMRSWYGLITVGPDGLITGNKATGDGGMMYTNNGSRYAIYGNITKNNATYGMIYLANQSGARPEATLYDGGLISENTGYGVYVNNGSLFTMEGGEISGNTKDGVYLREKNETFIMNGGVIRDNEGYGVYLMPTYFSFLGKVGDPLANITGGQIYGNKDGDIYVSDSDGRASDEKSRVMVAENVLQGERVIKTNFGTITLDENHSAAGFGTAKPEAKNKIKDILATENPGWPVVGSPLWFKPSTTDYHFTVNRPSSAKKTSLFLAYLLLQADGTPTTDAAVTLVPVKNEPVIDVTLTGLNPDTSYAIMFVNNKEYTLRPDDVTIYTGGGQDDEKYDNGGFPELTLYNCIDKIYDSTEVTIGDTSVTGTAADKMKALADQFTVTYKDAAGNIIKNDETPGEYTATIAWKNGAQEITIGGNDVKDTFETGTLIVRHTEDKV